MKTKMKSLIYSSGAAGALVALSTVFGAGLKWY